MLYDTSLYKGRIYIITNNGSQYHYDGGAQWLLNPIEDGTIGSIDLEEKLNKYGFGFTLNQPSYQKDYFFLDYTQTVDIAGTSGIDYTNFLNGDQFTITPSGAGTAGEWANFVISGIVAVNIVITAAEKEELEEDSTGGLMVDYLNTRLSLTESGVAGLKLSHFVEFFLYDLDQIGIKTKQPYAGVGYDITTADSINTPLADGLDFTPGLITGTETKISTDYNTLVASVGAGTDVVIKVYNTENYPDSFRIISIPSTSVSQIVADIKKLPEVFRNR